MFGVFFMADGRALNDIMNDVSRRLDIIPDAPHPKPQNAVNEMEAFRFIDDLLAKLHKEYVDAKEHRIKAQKEFGASDGMTDLSMILEDSAWCAMQTRYMELRGDAGLMKRAREIMEETRRAEEQAHRRKKEAEEMDQWKIVQMIARMKDKQKQDEAILWFIILVHAGMNNNVFRLAPTHKFNALALAA